MEKTIVKASLDGRFLAKKVFLLVDYESAWLIVSVWFKFIIK